MATLGPARIAQLLKMFHVEHSDDLLSKLSDYLDLLLKWNARTNLTAIRDPEEIVQRHFGESLFAARSVPAHAKTLLDLGSGAGFPGLPIQLARPDLKVTLGESQNKKSAFLREAVRVLNLETEVWAARVEMMPPTRLFDVVTLRAVDNPEAALEQAAQRIVPDGIILHLASGEGVFDDGSNNVCLPGSSNVLRILRP